MQFNKCGFPSCWSLELNFFTSPLMDGIEALEFELVPESKSKRFTLAFNSKPTVDFTKEIL